MDVNIDFVQKRIKILEVISLLCIIISVSIFVWAGMPVLLIGIGIGLLLQLWIYLLYKRIRQDKKYLKNKLGAFIGAIIIIVYFIVKN